MKHNYTPYDTAAIVELIARVKGLVATPRGGSKPLRAIEPLYGTPALASAGEPLYGTPALASAGETILKIAPPKAMWKRFPLQGLAAVGATAEGQLPILPSGAVLEIIRAIMHHCLYRSDVSTLMGAEPKPEVLKLVNETRIGIHPKPIDKKSPARKLSEDEKLARLCKLYGKGGELRSKPSRPWQSSQDWKRYVTHAQGKYESEWHRRMVYYEKLTALDVELEPYESWPEFLRRMAAEAEKREV